MGTFKVTRSESKALAKPAAFASVLSSRPTEQTTIIVRISTGHQRRALAQPLPIEQVTVVLQVSTNAWTVMDKSSYPSGCELTLPPIRCFSTRLPAICEFSMEVGGCQLDKQSHVSW